MALAGQGLFELENDDVAALDNDELQANFQAMMQSLTERKIEVADTLRNFNIQLSEEGVTLADSIIGDKEAFSADLLVMEEEYQAFREKHLEDYENPLLLDPAEMDATIDGYQEMYKENEALIGLLNEGSAIRYEDGSIFSRDFADLIGDNADAIKDADEYLATLNETLEDYNSEELAEMFGEDMVANIEKLMDIEIGTPFEDWGADAQAAFSAVTDEFATVEERMKTMYASMKATDTDFYNQLKLNNADEFAVWEARLGDKMLSVTNLADFQTEVDLWRAQQMDGIGKQELANAFTYAQEEGFIDEQAAESMVTVEQKAAFLKDEANIELIRNKIENRKQELLAEKAAIESSLTMEEAGLVNSVLLNQNAAKENDDIVEDLERAGADRLNNFIKSVGSIPGVEGLAGARVTASGITGVTNKGMVDIAANLKAIDDEIEVLDGYLNMLDALEEFKPADLKFELPDFKGTGGSLPTPSGKPSGGSGSGSGSGNKGSGSSGNKGSGSGSSGNKGSGSGSSGKEETEKEVEDLEFKKDIYYEINKELALTEQHLKSLEQLEDFLYGDAKLDNLDKQTKTLEKQRDLTQQKYEIAKKEASELQGKLSQAGVKFDEEGMITNFNQLLEQRTAAANALSGEAKEAAIEAVEALRSAMESYDELVVEQLFDYENELEEMRQQIQEKILEAIEYEYELNIEAAVKFKEDSDFFDDFLEGFEGIPDTIERALENFDMQYDALDAFSNRYQDIMKNDDLDPAKKIEAIEELKEDFQDALMTLKDIYESIGEYIEKAIDDNMKKIDEHVEKFQNINSELDDMIQMYELLGKGQDFDAINEMLGVQASSNEAQIKLLQASKKEMESMRDALEEGTEEWKAANDAVIELDEDIRKLALDTVKLYQEQFENSFKKSLNEIEKALSGGLGFNQLQKEIDETRKMQDKYYDSVEKTLWAAEMQKKIQNDIAKSTDPKKQAALQKFYEEEVQTLLDKDKLTAAEVERANILYDITMKQMALEDARANKTIMRLTRDDTGNWVYQYMTDLEAVASAQESLTGSLGDLMAHDKKVYEDAQDEILEKRKEFINQMQEVYEAYKRGEIESEEEFNEIIGLLQQQFNEDMLQLNKEFAEAEQNLAESTLGSIMDAYGVTFEDLDKLTEDQIEMFDKAGIDLGSSWEETIGNMIRDNTALGGNWETTLGGMISKGQNAGTEWATTMGQMMGSTNNLLASVIKDYSGEGGIEETIKNSVKNIQTEMTNYGKKVETVTKDANMDLNSMKNKLTESKNEVKKLDAETEALTKEMNKQFNEIKNNLIPQYNKLKDVYKSLQSGVKGYIDELNKAITAQKNLANEQNKPKPNTSTGGSSSSSGSGSSSGSSGGSSSSGSTSKPKQGSKLRVKSGRTWTSDSDGRGPTGPTTPYANRDMYVTNYKSGSKQEYAVGQSTNINSTWGWVKLTDIVGFKSGGYTGDWSKAGGLDGEGGRMALLHQKEMVLNAEDTKNILDSVALVRDYAQSLQSASLNFGSSMGGQVTQQIQINADFSGVQSAYEIEMAFDNIENRATQYARKLK